MVHCEIIIPLHGETKRLVSKRVLPCVVMGAYLVMDVWGTLLRWKIDMVDIYDNYVRIFTDEVPAGTVKFFKDEEFKSVNPEWSVVE